MSKRSKSSQEWFKIWDRIMYLEDTLSRISLSEISGASIQTIQKMQQDWMLQNDIVYDKGRFSHYKPKKNISLSLFSTPTDKELERMK